MKTIFNKDFTWKNMWSTLLGLILAALIFLVSFVLPAWIEYKAQTETGIKDMYGSYAIYTVISTILFYFAIAKNLWFNKKNDFLRDTFAVAIGLNCILWCLMFIAIL